MRRPATVRARSRWLRCYDHRPAAVVRLVCLPHAGGAASFFRPWAAALPPSAEMLAVQYPGRQDRLHEPLAGNLPALAEQVADALRDRLDLPLVLFGHSMGGLVGYEVARQLALAGTGAPARLVVSASPAPADAADAPDMAGRGVPTFAVPTVEVHSGAAGQDPALYTVPAALPADLAMVRRYRPTAPAPLTCPVSVLFGDDDPLVRREHAERWQQWTRGHVEVQGFPGDHFFVLPARDAVLATLSRLLTAHTWGTAP